VGFTFLGEINMKKYYWLKLQNDFFNQKTIKKLRKVAGGDTYTIIYLKMQLLSLKNQGRLFYEGLESTFAEELALEIDEDPENVKFTLIFLEKYMLLEFVEVANEYLLPETIENIGSEGDSAARVRKHRALHCNAPVTQSNTEKIRLDKNRKDNIYLLSESQPVDNLERQQLSPEFQEILNKLTNLPR
jgi:predicted phage replisome organizer